MAKRFGELSKKKKKKILGKPKYQGLTKKQVRKKYNQSKGLSNRSSLSTNNLSDSKSASATTAATTTKPSAATTTQSLLIQAGADDTDLRSGTLTGSKTGTEYQLNDASDLGYMKEFDPKTYEKAFGPLGKDPGGNDGGTPPGGNDGGTPPGGGDDDEIDFDKLIADLLAQLSEPVELPEINLDMPEPPGKRTSTYVSGGSAGGIRRRRSNRSKLGFSGLGTNQLNRNLSNLLSLRGINI